MITLARISDKKGRLTKNYREPTVFHASTRRKRYRPTHRRKTYHNTSNKYNSNAPEGVQVLGGCLVMLLLLVFIISIGFPKNSSNDTTTEDVSSTEKTTEAPTEEKNLDLSAFEGVPRIEGDMTIIKEYDSWVLDVTCKVKNNSPKDIETMKVYLITCYNGATPLESWKYPDYMSFENIGAWQSRTKNGTGGTTTYSQKEFIAYVAYIRYKDGTEWGEEELNHEKIVTRDARISLSFQEVEKFAYKN